ncbi:MAG: hypothetical protein M3Q23_13040 [Actinomycetota bacterium]|nr:hypothetical protein [Actinomycetota bacterium]
MKRGAVALLLLAAACTGSGTLGPFGSPAASPAASRQPPVTHRPTATAPPGPTATPVPVPTGPGSAADALRRLCVRPPAPKESPATPGPAPSAIQQVEQEVQQVRGFQYLRPVAVDAVTHDQLVQGLEAPFGHDFPAGLLSRRTRVWQLIGVIPADVGLRDAYRSFLSGQVIGYYDPGSGQLVFLGTTDPSAAERLTLAHELTHADDDQHFDLSRLNPLENHCQDEALMAATGAVEGSAQFFSFAVARRFFSPADLISLGLGGGGGSTAGVPPFVQTLALWPYLDGLNFITAMDARGGLAAVNHALQDFPVSTEQVMHPDRYPSDTPAPVDIPDLGPSLGPGWRDLDVMQVGEEWLKAMLALRLAAADAADAAAGWDGGLYRAWTDGPHVAVVLSTRWDSPADADEFAAAASRWLRPDQSAVVVHPSSPGSPVQMLVASDQATLAALRDSFPG